jgi:hypothetical protein
VHCVLLESAAEVDKICKFVVDLTMQCHEADNLSRADRTKVIWDRPSALMELRVNVFRPCRVIQEG